MSEISVTATALSTPLMGLLSVDAIEPGSQASYQTCKEIYLYHPLGRKMAEGPIAMVQSQSRDVVIQDSPCDEVADRFIDTWRRMQIDGVIANISRTSRIYGLATVAVVLRKNGELIDPTVALDLDTIHEYEVTFNVLDPLNTAGSDVLDQDPNAADFQRPVVTSAMGKVYHPSRTLVAMHESPVYLSYTASGFGYVGRSVYQRALYPLKSFLNTMVTDDMVARKAGLLVAKMKPAGSIVDRFMQSAAAAKRAMLKEAQTGQVLSIDVEESVESLNMQNIDGAGGFARTNILKNIATAADMPAVMLENETMVSGFGEGTEDAKRIASFVQTERQKLGPVYDFFDAIVMRMAWTPAFFETIQARFPEPWGGVTHRQAVYLWEDGFEAPWPEFLKEPESDVLDGEQKKLKAITDFLGALIPNLDPANKARVIRWASDNVNELQGTFATPLELDDAALADFLEEQGTASPPSGEMGGPGESPGSEGGVGQPRPSGSELAEAA